MDIKFKIIVGLVLIIVCLLFYVDHINSIRNDEARSLRNDVVSRDSVIQEKDSSYSRLSYEFTSQKEFYKQLENENKDLVKDVKKKDETIEYLLSIKVKPETVYVTPTTIIKDSIAYFRGYTKPYTVNGEFDIVKKSARNIAVSMDDFKLTVIEGKLENGFYRANIRFTDLNNVPLSMFKPYSIESAINTESEGKSQFLSVGVGGEVGMNNEFKVGFLVNIYNKNIFIVNYNLNEQLNPSISNKISVGYYRVIF